jgi:tetratricopeptide (TPR) repeat protein
MTLARFHICLCLDFSDMAKVLIIPIAAVLGLTLMGAPARADGLDDWINDCKGEPGAAVITACTNAIASGEIHDNEMLAGMLLDRAESYTHERQYTLAIADCDRVLALMPDNDGALYQCARAHDKAGDTDASIADYDRIIAHRPNDYFFYEGRAIANADGRRFDRALADFDHALRHAPGMPKPFIERVYTVIAMERYDLAVAALDTAVERWPRNGSFSALRGVVYARWTQGPPDRLARARKDFDAAIALTPDDPGLYKQRAALEDQLGDTAAAVADRNRANMLSTPER